MKNKSTITTLVILIVILTCIATTSGIFMRDGAGTYQFKSIRGKQVTIYGKGLYKDMSAEVAPQGIAQDYITLLIAIPLLLVSLWITRHGSAKGRYLLRNTWIYIGYLSLLHCYEYVQ